MCTDKNPFSSAEAGSLEKSDSLLGHEEINYNVEDTQLCRDAYALPWKYLPVHICCSDASGIRLL